MSTKISKRHLESLEQENFDELPGGIFNKGFVRAYAKYLGIDEEQAVADYVAADKQDPPPEEEFPLDIHERPDPVMNPRRSVTPVLLALLILACIAAGWTYWFKYRPSHQAKEPAESSAPQTASVSPPSVASSVPQTAQPSFPAVNEVAGSSSANNGQFTVIVKAREQSWVSIKADGQTITERVLSAGEEETATAAKEIMLTVGNAAGVDVKFNGTPQGTLGAKGTVRTLTFTPLGPERIGAVPQRAPRLQ